MTIIGRIVDAVLHDHQQPNYGYNNPSMAGPTGTPIYYTTSSGGICANSIHGFRHCRHMSRREGRCMRRDMRDMRRAARWDALLGPVTGCQQSPQQPQGQQVHYGSMQYSRQEEPAYIRREYGSAQQQPARDVLRETPHQAPSPPVRQSSVYNVQPPAGHPPPYVLEEFVKRGEKGY